MPPMDSLLRRREVRAEPIGVVCSEMNIVGNDDSVM